MDTQQGAGPPPLPSTSPSDARHNPLEFLSEPQGRSISMQRSPVRARRKQRPFTAAIIVICSIIPVVLVVLLWQNTLLFRSPGGGEKGSTEQEAVRAWLRENTNDGTWEEVHWEKKRSIDNPGSFWVDLKYRAKGSAGATVLYYRSFLVAGGKIVYASESANDPR